MALQKCSAKVCSCRTWNGTAKLLSACTIWPPERRAVAVAYCAASSKQTPRSRREPVELQQEYWALIKIDELCNAVQYLAILFISHQCIATRTCALADARTASQSAKLWWTQSAIRWTFAAQRPDSRDGRTAKDRFQDSAIRYIFNGKMAFNFWFSPQLCSSHGTEYHAWPARWSSPPLWWTACTPDAQRPRKTPANSLRWQLQYVSGRMVMA